MSFMQDSWRDLANAFCNERVLFAINAAHQVLYSNSKIVLFSRSQDFGEKRSLL